MITQGTGFLASEVGDTKFVVTCSHLLDAGPGNLILATFTLLNGSRYQLLAEIAGIVNTNHDLGILKVIGVPCRVEPVMMGRDDDIKVCYTTAFALG